MASSVEIPQDIIDSIIAIVDERLLETCALVSSSFLLPCRKRLFSTILLHTKHQACQRLHRFFVENPVVQSFVRDIIINLDNYTDSLDCTSVISTLRLPFCRLESFYIECWQTNWNDLSSELKDALSTIIHTPSLRNLNLKRLDNIPTTLLQGLHLTQLRLTSSPNNFVGDQPRLLVESLWWYISQPVFGPTEPLFMPILSHLRSLEIHIKCKQATVHISNTLSFLIRSLCLSLTSPPTLEHLILDMKCSWYTSVVDLCDADVWTHLDSIIAHPTGSRLRRVGINICYHDDDAINPAEAEVEQAILDSFPKLREKGILFVQVISWD